jgi:hypothetical protein
MEFLNAASTLLTDAVLWPSTLLPPLAGLAFVSLVTAVAVLLVIKATSNQRRIRAAKNGMYAALLEMRLFNDDLRAILRAQAGVIKHVGLYWLASLVPVLWLVVPFSLWMVQLEAFYGYAGPDPVRHMIVKAALRSDGAAAETAPAPKATLEVPPGLQVQTPPLWFLAAHEVVWQVSRNSVGTFRLRIGIDDEIAIKTLVISDRVARRSPVRTGRGWLDELRYPSERPLPASGRIEAISVSYAESDFSVFGWHVHWLVIFGVLTIAFAFALRRPLRVVF